MRGRGSEQGLGRVAQGQVGEKTGINLVRSHFYRWREFLRLHLRAGSMALGQSKRDMG